MMKRTAVLSVAALLAAGSAGAAVVTWEGGNGNWLGNANWNVGGTPSQTLPDQTTHDDHIVIGSGDTVYNPGGDMGFGWGASDITLNGGSITQSVTNWWQFNGTGTFTVNAGTVNAGADNVLFGNTNTDSASLVIHGGAFNHNGAGELKIRNGNTASVTGGSLTVSFLSLGDFGSATLDVSGGIVTVRDGAVQNNGIYSGPVPATSSSYINLTGTGVFHIGNINVGDATTAYLVSNKVRAGGDTNDALLQVVDDGNGGVNISLVPEPGSMALLAIGGLLVARRRRA